MIRKATIAGVLFSMLCCLRAAYGQSDLDISIAIAIAEAEAKPVNLPKAAGATRSSPARKAPAAVSKPKARLPSYPSRSASGSYWNQNGHAPTRQHLANTHGFDINWLNTLSQAQVTALHGDAHEGRVRSGAVRRGQSPVRVSTATRTSSNCPSGNCPTSNTYQRRGLFRWR